MAFVRSNFAPLGNTSRPVSGVGTATITGAPSWWSYATPDASTVVRVDEYFNEVAQLVNRGDIIYGLTATGGTPLPFLFYVIAVDKDAGTVDVADGTAISVTNTD